MKISDKKFKIRKNMDKIVLFHIFMRDGLFGRRYIFLSMQHEGSGRRMLEIRRDP